MPITNSRVAKEITRKLIIKEGKMDNVWFIPLQSSVTIPTYALSGLEIKTPSGSSNEALQELRENEFEQQVIYPHSFKMYSNTKTAECGEHRMHTRC